MSGVWTDWFGLGVVRLGLSPDQFWTLSLREWRMLCAGLKPAAKSGLNRSELMSLCRHYPDEARYDR